MGLGGSKGEKNGKKKKGAKGGGKSKITAHDKAVLDLKVQRDKLKQYQKQCNTVIERETEIARELIRKGDKKRAMLALKKKKYQENLLAKSEGMLDNMQEMIDSIEFAKMEQKVFAQLAKGNEVLKEIHAEMSLEEIDNLMLDTEDAIAYQKEIEESLAGGFTIEDEEELEAELAALEEGEEISLPDVPMAEPEAEPEAEPAKPAKSERKKQLVAAT